jgi:hypothetical protein
MTMPGRPGIIDLKAARARDYSKFLLRRNPFPSTAVPEETPFITVDRDSIIKHFQNVVAELAEDQSTTVTVVVGQYGSGKSHLLRLFKNSVNDQLLDPEGGVLGVYVRSPGRNFRDLVMDFMEDLGPMLLGGLARSFLGSYIRNSPSDSQRFLYDKETRRKLAKQPVDIDDFLRSSMFLDFFKHMRGKVFSKTSNSDAVFAFLALAHPNYSSIAWRWFIGESLSRDEKKLLQIENTIDDAKLAYDLLRSLFQILHDLGIKSTVILIDELEKLLSVPGLQRSQYQDDLRHMIDDNPKGAAFFFAIAPAQWDQLVKEPTALTRRLIGNVQMLDRFDIERTSDLVSEFLKSTRLDSFSDTLSKRMFPDCDPALAPFTRASIPRILKIAGGNISTTLLLCRKCLEYLADNPGQFSAVTTALAEAVAKREGFKI